MAVNKNGIVVLGAVFVDIKGFPEDIYVPDGRNAGHVEYIHGGVSRNVVEDIANLELRPTFLGIADNTALGEDVVRKLQRHKVNTEYMKEIPNGMGTWLAVFDHNGEMNKNKIRVYEPVETCYNFHQISGAKDQKAGASSLARGFLIS